METIPPEEKLSAAISALQAIVAHCDGVWDDPDLMKWGPLEVRASDVRHIAQQTLNMIEDGRFPL